MADIFISYSSKDREQAEQLTELLASAGLSVWIDKQGIDVATSWSKEIVDAIDGCRALVVLLSPSSIESVNVAREIALASERKKKILPLDLEPVTIPNELAYHLAGIQRAPMTNIDAIIRALGKLGLEATGAPQAPRITHEVKDQRKSLILMPFEDLSPTQDNQWFADGLAGELIDMLGKIKSLRILDRKTSLDLRAVKLTTVQLGKEFNTRYFVEGSVRKFGEQIKISVSLLDIETGDHLWQESYKGVMADIFDLQESVATQVVEGLKLHLTTEEKSQLEERGTENAEAYEFHMKGREYFDRHTKEGFTLAVQLLSEAILLDANYVQAYVSNANALVTLYLQYDRDPSLLDEAERLCEEVRKRKPEYLGVYNPLKSILLHRGRLDEGERMAKEWIEKEPENFLSHFALGSFYSNTGQHAKAIAPFEASLRLMPDNLPSLMNVVTTCDAAGEREKCAKWAAEALPQIERFLRLYPDDENRRARHAFLMHFTGKGEEALREARELVDEHSPKQIRDGGALYITACLFADLGEQREALSTFRRSIEAGFQYVQLLKGFLADEKEGVVSLAGTPEYEEVKQMVEKLSEP